MLMMILEIDKIGTVRHGRKKADARERQ